MNGDAVQMLLNGWRQLYGNETVETMVAHYGSETHVAKRYLKLQRRALNRAGLRKFAREADPTDPRVVATIGPVMHQATTRIFAEVYGEAEGVRVYNAAQDKLYAAGAKPAWGAGYPFDPRAKRGHPCYRPGPDWPPSLGEIGFRKSQRKDTA